MLKKCYGLFLGLVVLTGSACVSPTHASSASIVIAYVRAGSVSSASEEGVALYNNTSVDVPITNWCITNKAVIKFACFTPKVPSDQIILPAHSFATAVSTKMLGTSSRDLYTVVYEPGSGSSGSIVASTDTVSLIDDTESVIDQFSWTSSITSSQQWSRNKVTQESDVYIDTDSFSDWQKTTYSSFPASLAMYVKHTVDVPPETPVDVPELADEPEQPNVNDIGKQLPVIITELLPNAEGADTGHEFIELYNPNETGSVQLKGYKIVYGSKLDKSVVLDEYQITAGQYYFLTNSMLKYSLVNTSSQIALVDPLGITVSEVPMYTSPPEGQSWALIDGQWAYTTIPTPGEANEKASSDPDDITTSSLLLAPKPCAANQYRSPETNRCRLISTTTATSPTPCKPGQERNPETKRCRTITVASTSCKAGQEKNPETNRCRNIKAISTATYGIKGAASKQSEGMGWYVWAAVGLIVILITGYGIWEWRAELTKLLATAKTRFARKMN
jgi:hypothetical protein